MHSDIGSLESKCFCIGLFFASRFFVTSFVSVSLYLCIYLYHRATNLHRTCILTRAIFKERGRRQNWNRFKIYRWWFIISWISIGSWQDVASSLTFRDSAQQISNGSEAHQRIPGCSIRLAHWISLFRAGSQVKSSTSNHDKLVRRRRSEAYCVYQKPIQFGSVQLELVPFL